MRDQAKNSVWAPLNIYLNKFVGGVPYMAKASDISTEGLNLSNLIEPEHGKRRVGLQFQLPGCEEIIYAEGEIVREWSHEGSDKRSDVRFTLLTDRHRRLIDAYVGRHGLEH